MNTLKNKINKLIKSKTYFTPWGIFAPWTR